MNAAINRSTYQPHLVRADFIDFILEKVNPLWSINKVKAKVISVQQLSTDMYQLSLEPNDKFSKIWQAGQSVMVTVQIASVFHQRNYSIVEINDQGHIVLGIKAQGKVSNYLTGHDQNTPELYVELSQVQGDFVLHQDAAPALLIASGSGITAIYAMLKQALKQNIKDIYVLYFNRHPVYHFEMQQLAEQYPQIKYQFINTTQQKKHFDEVLLNTFCADWQQINAYVCGASPLMQATKQLYADHHQSELLHTEYFQPVMDETATEQPVTFRRSQRDFIATQSLLVSAEEAGLRPTSGCRMGICNTCTCTKVSGVTKNILTGEIESEDNRSIKLCISQALSPVVIDL